MRRAGLRLLPVALGQHSRRRDVGDGGLQLVLPTGDDVALALQHRLETLLRDFGRVVLLARADLGVAHLGAVEELRFGRARHEASDCDVVVLHFVAKREGEGVEERLARVIDRLERAGNEAGDRAGDENTPLAPVAHVAPDPPDEVECAGDVGVDHLSPCLRILVEEALAQSGARIGAERVDRTAARLDRVVELAHALWRPSGRRTNQVSLSVRMR